MTLLIAINPESARTPGPHSLCVTCSRGAGREPLPAPVLVERPRAGFRRKSSIVLEKTRCSATNHAGTWAKQALPRCWTGSPHRVAVLQEQHLLRHHELSLLVFHNQVPQQSRQHFCPTREVNSKTFRVQATAALLLLGAGRSVSSYCNKVSKLQARVSNCKECVCLFFLCVSHRRSLRSGGSGT